MVKGLSLPLFGKCRKKKQTAPLRPLSAFMVSSLHRAIKICKLAFASLAHPEFIHAGKQRRILLLKLMPMVETVHLRIVCKSLQI